MTATIWSKFYWPDWTNDPALRLCCLAAQGLWMRMLCIAAEANPTGYMLVSGKALDETGLAKLAGAEVAQVAELLAELERNGVFSRDRNNRIYSRRMVRDARNRAEAQKNGKKGGNPSLSKQREKPPEVKPKVKPEVNAWDKTQEPEARSQLPEAAALPSDGGNDWPADLVGEALSAIGAGSPEDAFRRSQGLLRLGDLVIYRDRGYSWRKHVLPPLNEWRDRKKAAGRPPQSWKYFSDIIAQYIQGLEALPPPPVPRVEPWAERVAEWRKSGTWGAWGPRPGEPGCRAPSGSWVDA